MEISREDFQELIDTMTIRDVADKLGVGEATVHRYIRKYGFVRRDTYPKGGRAPKVTITD